MNIVRLLKQAFQILNNYTSYTCLRAQCSVREVHIIIIVGLK